MNIQKQISPSSVYERRNGQKLRVLFVDDNPLDLQVLLNKLSDEFEVTFSTTAKEAVFYANQHPAPDIILIDVHMPTMDGFQLCEVLSLGDKTRNIPKIFISSNNRTSVKTKAFNLGCVDYVTKPVDPIELSMRLRTHVRLNQQAIEIDNIPALNPITNLYNFNHYVEELQKEWATCKRYDYPLSMIHCAIDGLVQIPDEYGQAAREKCIKTVANGIRNVGSRPGDMVAHIDEFYFVILLSDSHISYTVNAAKEIIARIKGMPVMLFGKDDPIYVSVSIGIASVYPDDIIDSSVLHHNAQKALEEAQSLGGNTWSLFSDYRNKESEKIG